MKYEGPVERSPEEILDLLGRTDVAPSDRVDLVLSALFYGESVEFGGDVLLKEFSEAKYKEKIYLKNLFNTFYGMQKTIYRIDESISLLRAYKEELPEGALEIDETIEELVELKTLFTQRRHGHN